MAEDTERPAEERPEEKVKVQSAEFAELGDEPQGAGLSLDLVLDISMPVTVELGRATMPVRELLQLRTGSVVQLDKMAGEPVDLFVRDVRFARGEVVVADNNFGLRITEIINPQRRIKELGKSESGVDKTNKR
jgi:flagellar motor switch protein FliN/FliY